MNALSPILILLTAFIAVFLEAAFDGSRHWLGVQIDLLPSLMVYAALSSSIVTITLLAVLGGLWFDSLSANPLGITILPLFLAGFLIYLRRGLILREQIFARWVLGLAASGFVPLATVILLLTLKEAPQLGWGFAWQWLVMTASGALLTPAGFLLFDGLDHLLVYRPVKPSTFRYDRQIRRGR